MAPTLAKGDSIALQPSQSSSSSYTFDSAEAEADALLKQDDDDNKRQHGHHHNTHHTKLNMATTNDDDDSDSDEEHILDQELSQLTGTAPTTAAVTPAIKRIHPAPIIAIWILLSSSVILQNAWILGTRPGDLRFSYPVTLTAMHMTYATVGTRVLRYCTHLLDGLDNVDMTRDRWMKNIVPIGGLFSASLIFSNLAYLTLSVPFIQMLKAFTSVAVLTMSVLMGLDQFNKRTTIVVLAISFGVAIASYGELHFVLAGFIFQAFGILFEATRLVAIQKLLQGLRMDPLVSLYYFAPVCATLNWLLVPVFEGREPLDLVFERVGPVTLFINCNVAFLLNVAVVFLIGCASSLVLTLSGVLKDILLVAFGCILLGSTVTVTQLFGYSIALGGLVVFKTPPEVMAGYIASFRAKLGM